MTLLQPGQLSQSGHALRPAIRTTQSILLSGQAPQKGHSYPNVNKITLQTKNPEPKDPLLISTDSIFSGEKLEKVVPQ